MAGGGALGASGRYLIGKAVQASAAVPFPVGTLCVNVLGCLLFGAVFVLLRPETAAGARWHLFLTTGLLGGFTTFSAFGHETTVLALAGRPAAAASYVALSVLGCLAAVLLGGSLATALTR